jgi:HAD superfamily hydrolase (TIGR01509 family)
MIRAVIFDIDGTLVDSVDLHAHAWRHVLKEFGHDLTFEQIRKQIGKGADTMLPTFLPPPEIKEKGEKMAAAHGAFFKEHYLSEVKPLPGVRSLFEMLKQRGKQCALGSSAHAEEVSYYKKLLQIEHLVDLQTTADDIERSKPYPDIYVATFRKLTNLSPTEVLVIGDAPYDAEAAARADLRTVCVRCGGFPEDELRRAGAIAVYDDCADILRHFAEVFRTPEQAERATEPG